jgi:hypothetical protein
VLLLLLLFGLWPPVQGSHIIPKALKQPSATSPQLRPPNQNYCRLDHPQDLVGAAVRIAAEHTEPVVCQATVPFAAVRYALLLQGSHTLSGPAPSLCLLQPLWCNRQMLKLLCCCPPGAGHASSSGHSLQLRMTKRFPQTPWRHHRQAATAAAQPPIATCFSCGAAALTAASSADPT